MNVTLAASRLPFAAAQWRVVACALLLVSTSACETEFASLEHSITLSAAIDERRRPVELRDRFSLEDEHVFVHVSIPPESAGPETRDFHYELFDGEGSIISAAGTAVTRLRPDWLVVSSYRINPEIDAPGIWALNVYVDGRRIDVVRFPVTATASEPLPEELPVNECCVTPSTRQLTSQVFVSTGVDEEKLLLRGRRERFKRSDGRMYVYLRLTNVPDGDHALRYDFYDGQGQPLWRHEQTFTSTSRWRAAWVWRELRSGAAGIWVVDVYFDGDFLGSVEVPVDE